METQKEIIEVHHRFCPDEQDDCKSFSFEYYGYKIHVDMNGKNEMCKGVWVDLSHKDGGQGFCVRVEKIGRKTYLSIDWEGSGRETKKRTFDEWWRLENLERSLSNIASFFKLNP